MDWGRNGLIAVPLNKAVYLWNAASGDVEELFCEHARTPPGQEDLLASGEGDAPAVTSVKWIEEGCILAVGLSTGVVEVYDSIEGFSSDKLNVFLHCSQNRGHLELSDCPPLSMHCNFESII